MAVGIDPNTNLGDPGVAYYGPAGPTVIRRRAAPRVAGASSGARGKVTAEGLRAAHASLQSVILLAAVGFVLVDWHHHGGGRRRLRGLARHATGAA